MRLGSHTGDCPPPMKIITSWKKVSVALEETDTPILNNIPNDIVSTDDTDNAIGALINHIRTEVENSSRTVPTKSNRKELPRDVSELIRDKNAALRRVGKYCAKIGPMHVLSSVRRVEEEVRQRVSLPPKDGLDPITIDEVSVQLALFADDTAFFLCSNCLRNILLRLQKAIDKLSQWLRLWRIEPVRVGYTRVPGHTDGFLLFSHPFRTGRTTKKNGVRGQFEYSGRRRNPKKRGKQPTAESEACLVQHDGVSFKTISRGRVSVLYN
ncbi:hypothetical protein EVAR_68986_1 [Eumeta japonica]|uniref:RNA-directed DNA polymerase from mobile element jockey n=1 Tax=Eumeta variegata TaxID=151549 RepID=A0A4C1ZZE4_EUMVA|nr:hypothetical protein EVAR_68986_1 [Eumeta japonica]